MLPTQMLPRQQKLCEASEHRSRLRRKFARVQRRVVVEIEADDCQPLADRVMPGSGTGVNIANIWEAVPSIPNCTP